MVTAADLKAQAIEIETDPTYYFNNGYSVDVGYATRRIIFRALPFKTDVPTFLNGGNDGFKQSIRGFSVDVDYFLRNSTKGFFIGPVFSYTRDKITNLRSPDKQETNHFYTGVRFGYRWFPFLHPADKSERGFFVTPFISPIVNIANNVSFADGRAFTYQTVSPFGGVHLGWKFPVRKAM